LFQSGLARRLFGTDQALGLLLFVPVTDRRPVGLPIATSSPLLGQGTTESTTPSENTALSPCMPQDKGLVHLSITLKTPPSRAALLVNLPGCFATPKQLAAESKGLQAARSSYSPSPPHPGRPFGIGHY
jgi:hypothetical protein